MYIQMMNQMFLWLIEEVLVYLKIQLIYYAIMYIKNMDQMRHCYKCKKCNKIFKCDKLCNRHETKCNILVQHEFKGGIYKPNQGIF